MSDAENEKSADISVEKMSIWDVDEISLIENESFPSPWPPWVFVRDLKSKNSVCLVARTQGRLSGYAVAWLLKEEMHIGNLAVVGTQRRKGIGSRLLAELVGISKQKGKTAITLEVRANNSAAIRLYEKWGFKGVAIKRKYYTNEGEDALVMVLLES